MTTTDISTCDRLRALLQRLIQELPPGAARFESRNVAGGTVYALMPSNPAAAPCHLHTEGGLGLVDFSFSESPTWELPLEGRYSGSGVVDTLREVEEMCRAVIAGNCETRRGPLSVTAKIYVGSYTYKMTDVFRISWPFGTQRYKAYADEE